MRVVEIFYSIQGEGQYIGCPAVFVRTAGCPVKCDFCDTKDSWETGTEMTHTEIIEEILKIKGTCHRVVITGGEPLIQRGDTCALTLLLQDNYSMRVHLETSGAFNIPDIFDWVTISPKPNLDYRIPKGPVDEIKLVVKKGDDVLTMLPDDVREAFAEARIWLQPMDGTMENMAYCYGVALEHPCFRVGVQLHKLLGVR